MSGLFGIFHFDGAAVEPRDLDRQAKRLAHLGPDRMATWSTGSIGLGHLLLRITREDQFDAQPLHDGNISLVADLRLDNREELAGALAIDTEALSGIPDSALLLAAYKKWGAGCVDHLIGDFAFAAWDARAQTLTLARDHMGQRHIFYHHGENFFAFATEIKGLWALPQVPRTLLEEKLIQTLLFEEPTDIGTTAYEGIGGVPGGTVLTIDMDGAAKSRRYWEPHADPAHEGRDEAYYIKTYREILSEAVACRLRRATTSAGVFMGGGFDSSAICALAGPVVSVQGRKFIAACSVMPEDYQGPIHGARKWVEMCRRTMPHLDVRYVTSEGRDILTGLEQGFLAVDNRRSPNHYLTEAMLAQIAAAGARITMDGHGGDYTLNPRAQNGLIRLLRRRQFRRFAAEFNAMRRHLHQSVKQTLVRNVLLKLLPASWKTVWIRYRSGHRLFGPTMPLAQQIIEGRSPNARPRIVWRSGESQRLLIERILRRQQDALAQGFSIAAAAHGLEFTQPFHDKRVVEFGLAIPEELYLKNGRTRYLARTALKDLYPPEFQDRPPGNDVIGPDFLMMAERVRPRLLAEIDRMEKAGRLSRYLDFARMRAMLTRHANPGGETVPRQAILGFLAARYIEWFRGDNA